MALDIVISVATEVAKLLIVPVGRHAGYAWNCNDNIDNMRNEVLNQLKVAELSMQRRVNEAGHRGNKVEEDADGWLKQAHDLIGKAEEFLKDESIGKKKCLAGLSPDWKSRYHQGRKAKEMLDMAKGLQEQKKEMDSRSIAYRECPKGVAPVKEFEIFESRKSVFKEIMQALQDPNVTKIGIFGITGVGKTTLVNEIAVQALEENIFEEVAVATVFQDHNMKEMQGEEAVKPDLRRIQGEIKDGLGFEFHMEMERGRAEELSERLKDERRKLVVLDNIWAGLKLEDVGIPSDHDKCKILMTSTSENVLHWMSSEKNFSLDVLDPVEARDWFKKLVGDVIKEPGLEEISNQVADKCACLPFSLVTVARGLKKKRDLNSWKNALHQLSSNDEEHVDLPVRLSYNLLGGNEIKKLFLLCAQLPPGNILVKSLFRYSRGMGLFRNCKTLTETRNRLLAFVDDLKASSLLLEVCKHEVLKMHDIVHNFAVSLSSKDHHVFTIADGNELDKWPAKDELRRCTAISLTHCKIPKLEEFECPELKSFILLCKDPSIEIPDNFFQKMKKLRVLDLSFMQFSSLPPSLDLLTKLKTLCLDFCILEKTVNMAIIGKLKKLEILSFWGSDIVQLPTEIALLTSLRLLDLSECRRLEVIPPNLLSCLIKLEELYMENSLLQWGIKGQNSRRDIANLAELKHLSNLCTLDIHITDANMLPQSSSFDKLERFRIFVGDGWNWSGKYPTSRTLKLKLNSSTKLDKAVKALMRRTEDLYLDELKGVQNSLCELDFDGQGFPQLKHLHVENSQEVQYIINSTEMARYSAFTRLESLSLYNLKNLEKICCGQLLEESLCNLKILKVRSCDVLKSLFPFSMAGSLLQLEEMKVSDCSIIKEIVRGESENDNDRNEPIKFPQLRVLTLESLPQFANFCSEMKAHSAISETDQKLSAADFRSDEIVSKNGVESSTLVFEKKSCFGHIFGSKVKTPTILETGQKLPAADVRSREVENENHPQAPTPLFNNMVVFPNLKDLKLTSLNFEKIWNDQLMENSSVQNLTSLVLKGCDNLKYLLSSSMVASLENLKRLEICNCKKIEEIIFTESFGEERMQEIVFHQLENLKLIDLPKLALFCRINLLLFPILKLLWIEKCPDLRKFISTNALTGSEVEAEAEIGNSTLFDEKVALPNLERLVIFGMNSLKGIWDRKLHGDSFSKLKVLVVIDAKELRNVFSSNYMRNGFQNLEILFLEGCNSLEDVFDLQGLMTLQETNAGVASKLKTLYIRSLPNLIRIWCEKAQDFLSFPKLDAVTAFNCPNLKSLFPISIARNLLNLSRLDVDTCGVEEIVSKEEGKDPSGEIAFRELTNLRLWKLPELKSFCPGCSSEWPKLKFLKVFDCDKLEIFSTEPDRVEEMSLEDDILQQPLFSNKKVICNLEELPLNSKDTTIILNRQSSTELFSNVKVLHLQYFHDESTEFPFDLIQRFNSLEKLVVTKSCFNEIFSCEGPIGEGSHGRDLPRIQHLSLDMLYNLKQIKLDHILKNLSTLHVRSCASLIRLAPSSASFQNLTVLDVQDCEGLKSLITFSTAESFVQLTKLSIGECKMLTEIIANEGDQVKEEISFPKLESLALDCLTSLTSFCVSNWTVKFPSLEEVVVTQCPKMMNFCQGDLHAPKLRRVKTGDKKQWRGDLNATIKQMFEEKVGFNGLQHLQLSEFSELKEIWHDPEQLPVSFFCDLHSLVVNECPSFHNAIPSNLLPFLNVLEELEVRNCVSVVEVFDKAQPNSDEVVEHLPKLNKLGLIDLPKLGHVWNENSRNILNFKNLKVLKIQNCENLRNIFSLTIVIGGLSQLHEIEVKSCSMIEEIIEKGEAPEGIRFPLLNSIILESLHGLKSFFSGSGTVECPSLRSVTIIDCPSTFTSTFLRDKGSDATEECTRRKIAFPNLEKLRVEWNDTMEEFWLGQFQPKFFCELKIFELMHFPDKCRTLPPRFLERLPSLENLVVSDASFEEIIFHDKENHNQEDGNVFLAQLKELELSKLPNLTLLSRDDPKSYVVFQNLETLKVLECGILKILVPSFARFKHLKVLEVSKCHGLENLILTSTAKSLVQLTVFSVIECDGMEAIVANEENEEESNITFKKLKCLRLECLQKIKGFYSGKCALVFPSLEEVQVRECAKMEFFSHAVVSMPKLKKVQLVEGKDKGCWEGNLNAPIQHLFVEMGQAAAQSKLPSSVRQPTVESGIRAEENNTPVLSNDQGFEAMHVGESLDARNGLSTKPETTKMGVSMEPEITQLDMANKDSHESDKVDLTKTQCSQITMRNVTDVVVRTQANPQKDNENESRIKQVFSAPTNFELVFSNMEEMLLLRPESSSYPASISNMNPEFDKSSGSSTDHYGYSMDLIKKISKKTLTEVAKSADALLLLTNLKILSNSSVLNSQQLQVIQNYIDNFDNLVTFQPYYDQQIDKNNALELYIEDNKKGIIKLKALYEDYNKKIRTLSASKEELRRRLHEVEIDEENVQAQMQVLYADVIARKGELERNQSILSEAARQQSEAVNKSNMAKRSWAMLGSLFP